MEFLAEQDEEHVMSDVELVVLHFVVGAPVFILTLTVAVVSATILEPVFQDVGRDGGCTTCSVVVAQGGVGVILSVVLSMLTYAKCFEQQTHALLDIVAD
jgi:membrane glycosyltransferase